MALTSLITDKKILSRYTTSMRLWQGIPGIEITRKGRIFSTFYSGGTTEQIGNYAVLIKADDGVHFSEPIAVATSEAGHRCYDPCLWIDPLDRLWFIWSVMPDHGVYAAICDHPDAEELTFRPPVCIGRDVMMNKPVVLTTGEWLFPIAVWDKNIRALGPQYDTKQTVRGSFAYKTSDNGETFVPLGYADVEDRSFDEHMIAELTDGRLMMGVRTKYGIGLSYSYDRGKTWTAGVDSGWGGPDTRFHIRRLPSGRLLLINHVGNAPKERSHLTALLSEDDGKTWKYSLLLDERNLVSYPDVAVGADGTLYITYDRERGAYQSKIADIFTLAREILYARITEEDIIAGKLVSKGSFLKGIVCKLGEYAGADRNPFNEPTRLSDIELADELLSAHPAEKRLSALLDIYPPNCVGITRIDYKRFDALAETFQESGFTDKTVLCELVSLARTASGKDKNVNPVVERIKAFIEDHFTEDFNVSDIADALGTGIYYICHIFKRSTGITITDYRNSLRLAKAKRLLIASDKPVKDIASACGMSDSSYFSKVFTREEGISPTSYRQLHTL